MSKVKIDSIASLKAALEAGEHLKYVYFWGHESKHEYVAQHCLSQWYPRDFEKEGIVFQTAEHYMMAEKALLFNDLETFNKIIVAKHPGEAKRLGREVRGFDITLWDQRKFQIVVDGNMLKFSQHKDLHNYLLNTGNKVLVEASPIDKIWGIGMAKDNPLIADPNQWLGLNLLGFALMQVRDLLQKGQV